ncbi:DUF1488 family protein [Bordetella genomosp. 9]|uniref:DUF1488 domain-containing protein n=1 Tax=Bordetella genomosp. 9 TaxID=1416803 RepID=A0A1W6Z1G2_9BORD|nr:DUF1488 family protein [Bordetella genomosp. 9]ARP87168.1 hypothetical protein CAL13_13825 [Bordetella genomosp. 9]ARP91155.1 hypothetical protein CAL14_13350 [Bordetella genomosp. 9]
MTHDNDAINDRAAHVIWFETSAGARKIKAGVSWEVLRARFGAGAEEESLLVAYRGNSRMLHALAQRKFLESHPLPVMLGQADFPRQWGSSR